MPSVTTAIEYLKNLESKGRGDEVVHVVLVAEEMKKNIENKGPKPKTRVQFETDNPELYSAFVEQKDRIISYVKNKSVALTLMLWAWRQLDRPTIDKLMAAGEQPEERTWERGEEYAYTPEDNS